MAEIKINFGCETGAFRDINGFTNGPGFFKNKNFDTFASFKKLAPAWSRLHDTGFLSPNHRYVDIHKVFPRFSADPEDPKNYFFKDTDKYIESLREAGCKIIYRLGYSATLSQKHKPHAAPPKDFRKWAAICEHIVAHYTEGWADGMINAVDMWEIWNEPNLKIFWAGTNEEFLELYRVTATRLRARFPEAKIGGCAFATGNEGLAEEFLAMCHEENLPLDFYSWHRYTNDPSYYGVLSREIKALLEKYGFGDIPSVLDEWNFNINFGDRVNESYKIIKSPEGAVFTAAALSEIAASPVDIATYYDYQINIMLKCYNGLMDLKCGPRGPYVAPTATYTVYLYLKKLMSLQNMIEVEKTSDRLYTLASKKDNRAYLMVTNYKFEEAEDVEAALGYLGEGFTDCRISRISENEKAAVIYEGVPPEKWTFGDKTVTFFEFYKRKA